MEGKINIPDQLDIIYTSNTYHQRVKEILNEL